MEIDLQEFMDKLDTNSRLVLIHGDEPGDQSVDLVLEDGTVVSLMELGPSGLSFGTFKDSVDGRMNYVPVDIDTLKDIEPSLMTSTEYVVLERVNDLVRGYE